MLAAQFVGASLLFPSLLGSWRMLLASICTAAVMLALASALASWSIPQVGPIALFVALWLIFLAILRASLPTFLHLAASALVSAYVIGGVLLWYLRADFGGSELVGPSWSYGPLCAALISPAKLPNPMWWGIVGMIAVALAAFFGHRLWKTPAP